MENNTGIIYMTLLAFWSVGSVLYFIFRSFNITDEEVQDDHIRVEHINESNQSKRKLGHVISTSDPSSSIWVDIRTIVENRNPPEALAILAEFYHLARKHQLLSTTELHELWQIMNVQKVRITQQNADNSTNPVEKQWSTLVLPKLEHILQLNRELMPD